ncbi:phosphoribosylamine-glycine ligase [Vibrio sinaloensis DSM 21326]|uniref:Phosphoribosylamine-glycine ligase n=1 Tax=Vibrio sinaloensis DSM 21326 TaxID=945550 RepID=E8M7A3_PHOS4|nr:capsular polysaccharide biosynthesis protein [Vibrio sinaloensis]EGA70102.1 phosphoribosylamine-glycine ligase [Vibrio sinaloensis DSM 21326]
MNILTLDTACSPFFSLIVARLPEVETFTAIFSKAGYKHFFKGDRCEYLGSILRGHTNYSDRDLELVSASTNHYSAYVRKFESRELTQQELAWFASFANYFRHYLREHHIDFVMMHNDLRWQHSIARDICLEEGVPFCVSELGLFRPYTTTLDFHGVNANSSVATLDVDFSQFANLDEMQFDIPSSYHGHESKTSKLNFGYFLILSKLGGLLGRNSPILHNAFRIRPYLKRFWQQSVKSRVHTANNALDTLPDRPYVFFPMQLENDTQFLIHSDFSSNQELLRRVEKEFYKSDLATSHQLVVKLHPNDLGCYEAQEETIFTKANTTKLVDRAASIVSVNSTVCMEALETDKPLFVLGRAFFAREDVCQPTSLDELSSALSAPKPVSVNSRRGFLHYLKYEYSIHGAGFSYTEKQLDRVANRIRTNIQDFRSKQ